MWALLVGTLLLATMPSDARTIRGVLGDAQELVGIRPAPAFDAFAAHFVTLAGEFTGPRSLTSAVAAASGATIDSSMSLLGPIFQDHAETLGAGRMNLNVIGQRTLGDASLFGQNFAELGQGAPPGLTLLGRTDTGQGPTLTGVRLQYHLDLHVWSVAIALTYGLTDDVDLSLVLPIVSSRLDCAVSADVVRATNAAGQFIRVPMMHREGAVRPVESTGIGDVVLRAKYRLPVAPPWRLALTLEGQFPSGDVNQIHGSGAYWITPGVNVSYRLAPWLELASHGALAFNISDSSRSQADYGVSASAVVWPRRLALVAEFLGRSQLDSAFTPTETDVLTYVGGDFVPANLLGIDFGRRVDIFDFAFGIRVLLTDQLAVFAAGSVPLNPDVALRPDGVTPTIGIGGTF